MFSLQVTMFIICSHISFLVSVSVSSCLCLFVCSVLAVASFLFFSKRRNSSLKEEKHVRAQGNPQTSLLLLYLINSLSTLYIHCFCFPLLLSSFACARVCVGGSITSPWLLVFLAHSPPPFLLLLLDGSLKFTDCTQILLADFAFPLCRSVFPQITSLVPSL